MLHQAILAAAHNVLLNNLYEALNGVRKQPEWEFMKQRSLTHEMLMLYRSQHRPIYDALRHRDPDAAADAVRKHLPSVPATMGGGGGETLQANTTANPECPDMPR